MRSLRISCVAAIVDRLNPLLHKDPVMILPPEMTALVFLHLSPADLLRSSTASRSWRERTLDSNLWRALFNYEGWSADMKEIRRAEARDTRLRLERSRLSPHKAPRRKPDGEPERTGSIKRAKETSDMSSIARTAENSALDNTEQWREQHGTLEADEDMVMHEDEHNTPPTPSSPHGSRNRIVSTDGASVDHAHQDTMMISEEPATSDAPSDLVPHLNPTLFTYSSTSSQINWLYLYKQRRRLEENWHKGRYTTFQLPHPDHLEEAHDECVYAIQHSRRWLVSGSRDKTMGIWNLDTQRRVRTLSGAHTASVLCLQFDEREGEDIVVSGGSDSLVVIWRFSTGEIVRKMENAHTESVLNLRFDHRYLITCSKDKTIKIFNRREVFADDPIVPAVARRQLEIDTLNPLQEYSLLVTLEGHGAAVNAIQVHEGQVVSASGDRTIKAWDINTGHCIRTYTGHTKGIACVQFDGRRIVSGSSDETVRIFDAATSAEVACLTGHTNLVRTVQARFGDMHDTDLDLEAAARAVDQRFHDARKNGQIPDQRRPRGARNAGSSDPTDVCAVGAKIPPGGGGNRWSRIVSGSYDESVIIWRKDTDGTWVLSQRLQQDEILQPRPRRSRAQVAPPNAANARRASRNALNSTIQQAHQQGSANAAGSASTTPHILSAGQVSRTGNTSAQSSGSSLAASAQGSGPGNQPATTVPTSVLQSAQPHHVPQPRIGHQHQAHQRQREESNRVFKLQFDSRRIICCSQNRVIVGWDFANGDPDLEQASCFFGDTN